MHYHGMTVRDIECNFEIIGIDVDHGSVYDWIAKYSRRVSDYIHEIVSRTNNRTMVRADEIWIKVKGDQKYLSAGMDDDARYWLASDMTHTKFQHNADNMLELTKTKIGKIQAHFATDGLPDYMKSSKKVFGKNTNHIRHIHLAGNRDRDNNKMECLNGEIRDSEKVFRGLKKFDVPLIESMKAHRTKKYGSQKCRTAVEQVMIEIDDKTNGSH